MDLGNFALGALGGRLAIKAEIIGDFNSEKVARASHGVSGLNGIIEGQAQGVRLAEIVDITWIAEAERGEIGGKGSAVDRGYS